MKRYVVNLTSDGRYIESEAKLNKKAVRQLYWFFEPEGSDNTPLTHVGRAERAGFGPNSMPCGMYLSDSDGVCKHRRFRLSVCGKDKFKVSVGMKRDGSDKKTDETYEVWRRFYFSVRYMRTAFQFAYGPVHDEYRKHGIWPVEIAPAGGARVQHIEYLETRQAGFALGQTVTESRLEARIILVDRLWISKTEGRRVITGQLNKVITFPHKVWPVGEFISGDIEGVDVRTIASRSGNNVTLHIGSNPALRKAALKFKVRGSFSVKLREKVLNGSTESGPTGRIVIASRTGITSAMRSAAPRQGTMIHEIAHGFKMVPRLIQEYNEFNGNPIPTQDPNPSYYQNGGGHCKTGAGGSPPVPTNGQCVMYHAGSDARPLAFCADCLPIVKRMDINRDDMPWSST